LDARIQGATFEKGGDMYMRDVVANVFDASCKTIMMQGLGSSLGELSITTNYEVHFDF
jgi:hypothetical protein